MNTEENGTPAGDAAPEGGGVSPTQAPAPSAAYKAEIPVSTNTVVLSRKKFGMQQVPKKNAAPPPSAGASPATAAAPAAAAPAAPATQNLPVAKNLTEEKVYCPGCNADFEIEPAFYGAVAECSECGLEFRIPSEPTVRKKKSVAVGKKPMKKGGARSASRTATGGRQPAAPAPQKKGMSGTMLVLIILNFLLVVGGVVWALFHFGVI